MEDEINTSLGETIIDEEALEAESINEFFRIIEETLGDSLTRSSMGESILKQIEGGKKTVYSKTIRETKIFEKSFLPILLECFKSLSKILKDPKKAIRYEEQVVPMEKVKKVNSLTVRHLASHTQYIKTVDEEGSVIPSKLLTEFSEDELGIYENRFIKTLINRICKFLSLRLQIMKKNLDSYETKSTVVTNDFKLKDKTKVKVELSVKMESEQDSEVKQARDTYEKTKDIHEKYKTLRSSQLMQALKNYKEVTPPILKTNIITKNPEFKICYNTWIFLDRYNQLAFDVNVREKKNKYSEEEARIVDKIFAQSVGTILYFNGGKDLDESNLFKSHTLRNARELSKMDDEYKFKPDSQKLEKFEMSEYFLNKTQEFYQQSLEDKVNAGMEKKYSLELVFREMQEVLNSIYPPLFEIPQEDEFEDVPLPIKLERAKKKADVLDTITRLKETDYNKTKKEYEDTLKEIQVTEEKIRQQEARELRLKKLAEEKAARAKKRAEEREEARRVKEELEEKARQEREKLKAERDEAKQKEKEQVLAAKAKLQERRARILEEAQKLKEERKKAREAKERERDEAARKAKEEAQKLEEQEKALEAEKAQLDAKEILRRRREIIKAKASAQRAKEEAEKALEDAEDNELDDLDMNQEVQEIDQELDKLLSDFDTNNKDDNEEDEESLSPKQLLHRRREAIRQKALADRETSVVIEDDEVETKPDNRALFAQRRKEREEKESLIGSTPIKVSDEEVEERPSEDSMEEVSIADRNREIIKRRQEYMKRRMAQQSSDNQEKPSQEPEKDPRELLRQRREAMRARALANRNVVEDNNNNDSKQDPRELLRQRREAIRAKALAAKNQDDEE